EKCQRSRNDRGRCPQAPRRVRNASSRAACKAIGLRMLHQDFPHHRRPPRKNTAIRTGMRAALAAFLALQASVVFAQLSPLDNLPQPDPAKAHYDDACAMFMATRIAGYTDEKMERWAYDCSRHPDRMTCDATKKFMEDSKYSAAELACGT